MQNTKRLITAPEASVRLGLSREVVVRRIQLGHLAGGRVDGRWMAEEHDVERLARALKAPAVLNGSAGAA